MPRNARRSGGLRNLFLVVAFLHAAAAFFHFIVVAFLVLSVVIVLVFSTGMFSATSFHFLPVIVAVFVA